MTTRSGAKFNSTKAQMGRAGRKHGAFAGKRKRRKGKRRSSRGRDVSSDEEPEREEEPPELARNDRVWTRSQPVRCTDYGPHRKIQFPAYKFCHPCDLWDEDKALVSKKSSPDSNTYCCTGKHTSSLFPTELKKDWCPSRQFGTRDGVTWSDESMQFSCTSEEEDEMEELGEYQSDFSQVEHKTYLPLPVVHPDTPLIVPPSPNADAPPAATPVPCPLLLQELEKLSLDIEKRDRNI